VDDSAGFRCRLSRTVLALGPIWTEETMSLGPPSVEIQSIHGTAVRQKMADSRTQEMSRAKKGRRHVTRRILAIAPRPCVRQFHDSRLLLMPDPVIDNTHGLFAPWILYLTRKLQGCGVRTAGAETTMRLECRLKRTIDSKVERLSWRPLALLPLLAYTHFNGVFEDFRMAQSHHRCLMGILRARA
jgi:hypothetical protein